MQTLVSLQPLSRALDYFASSKSGFVSTSGGGVGF